MKRKRSSDASTRSLDASTRSSDASTRSADASTRSADPINVFFNILDKNKAVMQDVILHGNYDSFLDQQEMHYPERLDEMFRKFSKNLHGIMEGILPETKTREIYQRMTEMRGVTLPNFLSPTLMKSLVNEEIDKVSEECTDLVPQTHEYARKFVCDIIENSTSEYPSLQAAYKEVVDKVLTTCQTKCLNYVCRVLEKERSHLFIVNDYYMADVKKLRNQVSQLNTQSNCGSQVHWKGRIKGFTGFINLRETQLNNPSDDYLSAFDTKVNLAAYCKVVYKRIEEAISLELKHSLAAALLRCPSSDILKTKVGLNLSILMEENS